MTDQDGITSADLLERAMAQEAQARQLLLDEVTYRASKDPEFRQLVVQQPDKAVRQVVKDLPSEKRGAVNERTINDTTEKIRSLSPVLPGLKEEKVEHMVFTTIDDTRHSYKISLRLTQVLFYSGLVMIAVTFLSLFFLKSDQLAVIIFGGGSGFLGVVTALLVNPIDRVQNVAGNLVQLEIVFLSYYKQITMLSLPANLCDDPKVVVQYSHEVRQAMEQAVAQIESFCKHQANNQASQTSSIKS
jgi:hypothetical protein